MFHICIGTIIVVIWLLTAMYLYSLNNFEIQTYETGFTGKIMKWNKMMLILMMYKIFILTWILNFLHENAVYVTMSSVTSYYFSTTREYGGHANVDKAIRLAYTKHAGSIAIGSIFHTLVRRYKTFF